MGHLIELKDIYKIYQMGEETVHALDGISMTVDRGEFVAIVGQSGSGKSTAMNIIGCLDVPTSGTYHLGGVDVSTMDDDQACPAASGGSGPSRRWSEWDWRTSAETCPASSPAASSSGCPSPGPWRASRR